MRGRWTAGLLAGSGILVALLLALPSAQAWNSTDSQYAARDNQGGDGGPPNMYATYSAAGGWTACNNVDDGITGNVMPASFNFKFYGTAAARIVIDSNGYLTFNNPASYTSTASAIPNSGAPNNLVAGWWDDLRGDQAGSSICWQSIGSAPNRVFLVRFDKVQYFGSTSLVNFMIVLFEGQDVVEIHYNGVTPNGAGTAGIEGSGTAGNGIPYRQGTVPMTTEAVQFRPLSAFPTSRPDTYVLDYLASGGLLKVQGGTGTPDHKLLLAGPANSPAADSSLGNVPISATYVASSGPAAGAKLTTLSGGVCGTEATNTISTDGAFCLDLTSLGPGSATCAAGPYSFRYHADDAFGDDPAATPQDVATVSVTVTGCDDPPVANNDPAGVDSTSPPTMYAVSEDQDLAITIGRPSASSSCTGAAAQQGLLCNDSDDTTQQPTGKLVVKGAPTTATTTAGATADVNPDGTFTYHRVANYCGTDSFTYKAWDGIKASPGATAYIAIACVADSPAAVADAYNVDEDCATSPSHACASASLVGVSTCAPTGSQVKGVGCNDSDADDVPAGGSTHIAAATVSLVTDVLHGALSLQANGAFTYVPAADYCGPDTFVYKLVDDSGAPDSSPATVSITVTCRADTPAALADAYSPVPSSDDTPVSASEGLLANDGDADNFPPAAANLGLSVPTSSVTAVSCLPATGGSGTVAVQTDGSFVYHPTGSSTYTGDCSFNYQVTDGMLLSTVATVTLHVQPPIAPFAITDRCPLIIEDPNPSPAECGNLRDNDYCFGAGARGDCSAATSFYLEPATAPPASAGTLTVDSNGAYRFAPALNYNGAFTFRYHFTQVNPAGGAWATSAQASATIQVTSVNDVPIARDQPYVLNEDCESSTAPAIPDLALGTCVAGTPGVSGVFTSVVGALLTGADDRHGSPTAPNEDNAPLQVAAAPGGTLVPTARDGLAIVFPDGHFIYTIPADMNTQGGMADSFTFQVKDTLNGLSSQHTATFTIKPRSDIPVARNDPTVSAQRSCANSFKVFLGTSIHFPRVGFTGPRYLGLLDNDYDVDNGNPNLDALHAAKLTEPTVGGTLAVNDDGSFDYTPPGVQPGTVTSFTYTLSDSSTPVGTAVGTAYLCIDVNQPPIAAFTRSAESGATGASFVFTDTSTDIDGHVVKWAWDFGDGTKQYYPGTGQTGPATHHAYAAPGLYLIQLTVTDDVGDSTTTVHSVTVGTPANGSPGSVPASTAPAPIAYAGIDQNVKPGAHVFLHGLANNQEQGYFFAWSQYSGKAVNMTGNLTSSPQFDAPAVPTGATETLVFRLQVSDGSHTSQVDEVKVRVTHDVTAPIADAGQGQQVVAGANVQLSAALSFDPNGLALNYTWTQLSGPRVRLDDNRSATPSFVIPADASDGVYLFRVEVSNGHLATADTVQILASKATASSQDQSVAQPVAKTAASPRNSVIARSHKTSPEPVAALVAIGVLGLARRRRDL